MNDGWTMVLSFFSGISGSRRFYQSIMLFLYVFGSTKAHGISVTLNWQQVARPGSNKGLILEVSGDKGFGEFVYTGPANPTGLHSLEVPREGVYHWRMVRPAKPGETSEQSSPMSGTFAAFEPAGSESANPKLTWQAAAGADRYKLVVYAGGNKIRELTTTDLNYVVSRESVATSIEVVPYWQQRRAARTFHYDPSLELVGPKGSSAPVSVPLAADEQQISPGPIEASANPNESNDGSSAATGSEVTAATETAADAASQVVSEKPDALPPEPEKTTVVFVPGLRRLHHVQVFGGFGREDLRTQKLETDMNGTSSGPYLGGGFWTNPVGGIVIDVRGDYHEFKAKLKDKSAPELDSVFKEFNRSRFVLGISAGFDFLRLFDWASQHQLSADFASAMTQIPLLDVEVADGSKSSDYPWKTTKLSYYGAGLTYSFFFQGGAVTAFGRSMVNATREASTKESNFRWYGLQGEYYASSNLSVNFSGQMRQLEVSRCSNDAGTCLAEGKVRTYSDELLWTLGVGAVRF